MSSIDALDSLARQAHFRIRPLAQADLPALEWDGEFTHFRRVYVRAFQRAQAGNAALWVADDEPDLVIGQVFVLLNNELDPLLANGHTRAFIHSFRVRPQYRNLGLGTRLMQHAETDLRARGFTSVALNVARENDAALRLYERLGYRQLHPISGYWSFIDHLGQERQLHEPGWRLAKDL
jgi:ribosomal protein S18 acetylase RimI-like enzyme